MYHWLLPIFYLISCVGFSLELSTFQGKAYDKNHLLLFTEEYVIEKKNDEIKRVTTRFLSPEGTLIAEMTSDFSQKKHIPEIHFAKQTNELIYGTTLMETSIELFKKNATSPFKRKTILLQDNMVAGPGFYFYILEKLDSLLLGHTHHMLFLQPTRLNTYPFKVKATSDSKNPKLVHVHLTAEGGLSKVLIPDMHLVIDQNTRCLVSYKGLSGFLTEELSPLATISVDYSNPITMNTDQ